MMQRRIGWLVASMILGLTVLLVVLVRNAPVLSDVPVNLPHRTVSVSQVPAPAQMATAYWLRIEGEQPR